MIDKKRRVDEVCLNVKNLIYNNIYSVLYLPRSLHTLLFVCATSNT